MNLPPWRRVISAFASRDDNLWLTESGPNKVAFVNPATHAISEFTIPTNVSAPNGIAAGPDGRLWFVEETGDKVGSIDPTTHTFAEFPLSTASANPRGIAAVPGGRIWFTELLGTRVGSIDPTAHSVTLTLAGTPKFAQGGRLVVVAWTPGGVADAAAAPLDGGTRGVFGDDGTFVIAPKGSRISR